MVRLEHPGRAALTLALLLGPAVIAYFSLADAQAWSRAIAGLSALLAAGLAVYLLKLVAVPAAMSKDAETARLVLVGKLASYDTPDDDASLRQGLSYILHRDWNRPLWESDAALPRIGEALETVRKLAARERIIIWGQTANYTVHQQVPPHFWVERGIDLLSVTEADQPIRSDKNHGLTPPRWNDLKINRAQFEREWPKA